MLSGLTIDPVVNSNALAGLLRKEIQMDYDVERMLWNQMSNASAVEPANSPTYNRVAFLGDDGYGFNAVGRI